jgi:hypothetical protein
MPEKQQDQLPQNASNILLNPSLLQPRFACVHLQISETTNTNSPDAQKNAAYINEQPRKPLFMQKLVMLAQPLHNSQALYIIRQNYAILPSGNCEGKRSPCGFI